MSAVAAAVVAGGVGSAVISGQASQNAANTQSQAADRAGQLSYTEWQKQQAELDPYLQTGRIGLQGLESYDPNGNRVINPELTRKFTMADFQQDPGYQFQLSQGMGAMQRSAAAAGMINSTGTMENLNNYAQGMANTDYQQALNNFTNNQQQRYNMLSGMAGMGLNASGMNSNAGINFSNSIGNNMTSGAAAQAAGQVGMGNAISSGIGSIASGAMYNAMSPGGGGGGGMTMPQLGSSAAAPPSNYGSALGNYEF